MLEVDHARQLLAECNMPEAACQLDALLETAAAKDTICQWQMLLNGNAAQGAANPPPLRRRNGPPPLKRADILHSGLMPWCTSNGPKARAPIRNDEPLNHLTT